MIVKPTKFNPDTRTLSMPDLDSGEFLQMKFSNPGSFGLSNLRYHGTYKDSGWIYDFRESLKQFFVEGEYGIYKTYAPNKGLLRLVLDYYDEEAEIYEIKEDNYVSKS